MNPFIDTLMNPKPTQANAIAMAALMVFSTSAASKAASDIAPEQREFFEKEVRPLLVKRCFECHDGKVTKGGLSLASAHGWQTGGDSGPAILPGKPDDSLLIRSVRYTDEDYQMPPPKKGKLPDEEIAILTKWVAMGAPDPRSGTEVLGGMTLDEAKTWWAFQPLPELAPANPAAAAADAAHIDELLQSEIERNGLTAAPAADRRTLLRRLSYNLIGLPPSAAEVETFLADASPDAFAKQIERLLASPQYGVQWGRRWLDVVRYADSAGDNSDRPLPHAWRYRNWVMDAFQRDLPYDQFVRLQLAGDLITDEADPQQHAEGIVATGYLALARRFGFDSDKDMFLTYEDTIDNLGKSFLGLTLACARCHDHKYDPVSAEDYYALYGILESSRFSFAGCEKNGQPRDLVPLVPQSDIDAMKRLMEEQQSQSEAAKHQQIEAAKSGGAALAKLGQGGSRVIASSKVAEGGSVPFEQTLRVRKGEVLQLTVSPNEKHGADTTLVEWTIAETGGAKRSWSTADLVPDLIKGNPLPAHDGALWCFLETSPAPMFLADAEHNRDGNAALKSWGNGATPVIVVNTADQQVMAWTTLAPESFFMHPGHQRPVAQAWVSPLDGELTLSGRVADVHPSQGDGVAFELTHIALPEYGPALVQLGGTATPVAEPEPMPVIPVAYAVVDREAPKNAHFQERGEPENLGPEVPRRWLTVFGGEQVPPETGSGRRELGDWIARHPLTARVMANRLWQWHFGHGLVRSPNDFGTRGEPPTHPELLDFLTARFVQSGYSVKAMHRLILQTAAYQRADATPAATDPDNRLLAHFSRRRLTAEELRDSVLLASGQLDLTPGTTHPFPEESTWKFSQHRPFNDVYETDKRSAYLMVQRQRRHPYLALFDGADPNASTPARETSTVPTQALYFINDPVFHAQAAAVAEKLLTLPDDAARITSAWSLLLQRKPTADEAARARTFLAAYPGELAEKWAAQVRVLMASNEYLNID
jgi:hypothetical protein